MTTPAGGPTRQLRSDPDLEQLKRQAKELLDAFRAGDSQAREEVSRHYHHSDPATFALHDAQLVLARAYGFESWPKLKAHVERITVGKLAGAVKAGDLPRVRRMLKERPELANTDMAENDEHRALHYAVLERKADLVRVLMQAGADARKGIYPHRDATSAYILARERGYGEIVAIIEEEEQRRREQMSCPNATVSPVQNELSAAIASADDAKVTGLLARDPTLVKACDSDGAAPLHVAASALQPAIVAILLGRQASVIRHDPNALTPLDRAALAVTSRSADEKRYQQFLEVARLLRARGAELTPRAAVALGDAPRIRELHQNDPKSLDLAGRRGGGLLTLAVKHDRPEMLRLLLDLGLDPDERHRLGAVEEEVWSSGEPLWHAAAQGKYEIATLLLDHGANPNSQVYASGGPLYQAFAARDEQMKALLRSRGALEDATVVGLFRDTPMSRRMLEEDLPQITRNAWAGQSTVQQLLWGAACGGEPEIVQLCLERIDWPREDPRWFGVLEQPLRIWNHGPGTRVDPGGTMDRSTYPVCFGLILRRADPNIVGKFGCRMLHRVAALGDTWGQKVVTEEERITFARMLLDAGAKLDVRDELLKSTPLGWASRWGREPMVRLLLERGASPVESDAEPWATPLAWAKMAGHAGIAELLRANGAS